MCESTRLVFSASTGHLYITSKDRRTKPEKVEIKEYDPIARQRVIYKEAKIR